MAEVQIQTILNRTVGNLAYIVKEYNVESVFTFFAVKQLVLTITIAMHKFYLPESWDKW